MQFQSTNQRSFENVSSGSNVALTNGTKQYVLPKSYLLLSKKFQKDLETDLKIKEIACDKIDEKSLEYIVFYLNIRKGQNVIIGTSNRKNYIGEEFQLYSRDLDNCEYLKKDELKEDLEFIKGIPKGFIKTVSSKHHLTKVGYRFDAKSKTLVPISEAQKRAIGDAKQAIREIGMLAKRLKLRKPKRPKMSAMEKRMRLYDMREDPREYIKRMTQKPARTKIRGQKPALIQSLEDDKLIRDLLEEYDKEQEELDRELANM